MIFSNRIPAAVAGPALAAAVLLTHAGPAAAHPGDHSHVDVIVHLLTEPDHLAMIGLALVVAVAGRRWWRSRAQRAATRRDRS